MIRSLFKKRALLKDKQDYKIEMIVKEAVKIIHNSVDCDMTIFLIGSYARNCGIFDENGHPLEDIDMGIIVKDEKNTDISNIKRNLQNSRLLSHLTIDLHFYTLNSLYKVLPLRKFYDLKYNSELILGKDIREEICNFDYADISKYDGLRMLAGELIKIIKRERVNESKLHFVLRSAQEIENCRYTGKNVYSNDKTSLNEFVRYALEYYKGGFKGSSRHHLQPTINYIFKKKFSVDLKNSFFLSFILQVFWTFLWAIKTRNIRVLSDWRDPALRIYYSIIYYFSEDIEVQRKTKLFRKASFPNMEYFEENLLKLHEAYFLGDRWKSIKKSNWSTLCKVEIK